MRSKRILIIDNDKGIRDVIAEVLTEEGYAVTTISHEKKLTDYIAGLRPDAILLDVIKPSDEGAELCKALKAKESTRDIPLIVLSTHMKITETIKEVCADDVLAKPFDITELVNVVENQL